MLCSAGWKVSILLSSIKSHFNYLTTYINFKFQYYLVLLKVRLQAFQRVSLKVSILLSSIKSNHGYNSQNEDQGFNTT